MFQMLGGPMRVILTSLLGALFALTIASPASAAQVNLPAGTRVEVRLVNPISSGAATATVQLSHGHPVL